MTIEEQAKAAVEEATKPIIDQFKKMVEQIKENGSSINSPVIKDARLSKEFLDSLTPAQRELLEKGMNDQEELDSRAEFEKFIKERQAAQAKTDADAKALEKMMM